MPDLAPSPQTTLVILLGASAWPQYPSLTSSLAFARSATKIRAYFGDSRQFDLPEQNWLDLFDQRQGSPLEVHQAIRNFLKQRMARLEEAETPARDLLFYYLGHGVFALDHEQAYHLAIRCTSDTDLRASGVSVAALADTLKTHARRLRRTVILDCCFAADSFKYMQAGPDAVAIRQVQSALEEEGIGYPRGFPERGTALLCSSGHKEASLILEDESGTMFSEALVRALTRGNPRHPDTAYLTLSQVKALTEEALEGLGNKTAPRPYLHSPDQSDGDIATVPLFPNAAAQARNWYMPPSPPPSTSPSTQEWPSPPQVTLPTPQEQPAPPPITPQKTKEQWRDEGNALWMQKRYEEALAAYERALQLDPNYTVAWFDKSDFLYALERYEEALAALERALQLAPNDAEAWINKGDTLSKLKRYQEALAAYKRALQLAPEDAEAQRGRDAARQALQVQARPARTTDQWVAEGDQHRRAGRAQEALSCYWQAIQVDPTNARAYTGRGYVLWQLGHQEKALEAFEQAIQRDVNAAEAFTGKGSVLSILKRYEEALFAYERAIHLAPADVVAQRGKGEVLLRLQRPEEALAAYERALQLAPQDAEAQYGREAAYQAFQTQARPAKTKEQWGEEGNQGLAAGRIQEALGVKDELVHNHTRDVLDILTRRPPVGTLLLTLTGHSSRFTHVAWSPDGRRLASFSTKDDITGLGLQDVGPAEPEGPPDTRILLWDATSGQCLATLQGHTKEVNAVVWSPDGRRLASTSADGTLRLWDAMSGQQLVAPTVDDPIVLTVAWSSNGRLLATAGLALGDTPPEQWDAKNGAYQWDAESGKLLATFRYGGDDGVWSPDGRRFADSQFGVRLWDAESGKPLATLTDDHVHGVVVWSPDGRRLAAAVPHSEGASEEAILHLWDAESGKLLTTLKGPKNVFATVVWVVWSPDGHCLAAYRLGFGIGGVDIGVSLWDTESGKLLTTLKESGKLLTTLRALKDDFRPLVASKDRSLHPVASMAWSPDGRRVATASAAVRLWDTTTGKLLSTIKATDSSPPHQVVWSPDGLRLASASEYNIRVWWVGEGSR